MLGMKMVVRQYHRITIKLLSSFVFDDKRLLLVFFC